MYRQQAIIWINDDQNLWLHIDGLVPERHNSIANALELVFVAHTHWYDISRPH